MYCFRRAKSTLSRSVEAVRQSQMGIGLDPLHPVAPEVPILEEIFQDKGIFAKDQDFLTTSGFVSPSTPLAESPQQIKGCVAVAVSSMFSLRLLAQSRTKYVVPNVVSGYYFPPWHPIAQFRKSRPALVVIPAAGLDFNGNQPHVPSVANAKSVSTRKRINLTIKPMDLATWRQAAGRKYRAALYQTVKKPELDGVYVMTTRSVPTNAEAVEHMAKLVKMVTNSDMRWSENLKPATYLGSLCNQLLQKRIKPPTWYLERQQWQLRGGK